ncbi:MAG: pilus assembly protein PilM [Chloroflexota bacterium]|nr:pilus assembly protein PilM [Chloroflexota bacterium]
MRLFGGLGVRGVVTVAFEAEELRFLTTQRNRVRKWGKVPLPTGLVSNGLVTSAVEMGKILDDLFEEQRLDRKRVITSVSALRYASRMITIPRVQAAVLQEAIVREAKKELPIPLDDLYLSWAPLPSAGEQQRVHLLGVRREFIDAQVQSLEAAGIRPFVMDLKPLALVRAVGESKAIIVNLETHTLDIVLVVDYLPAIIRTFSFVGEDVGRQGKRDRLRHELAQTIRFYNDGHGSAPVRPTTPVYVMGNLLGSPEAVSYMKGVLDRPVRLPRPPIGCPQGLPVPEYMANFGLALKKV